MGKKQSQYEPGSNQYQKTPKPSGVVPGWVKVPLSSSDGVLSEAQVAAAELWAGLKGVHDKRFALFGPDVTRELAELGFADDDWTVRVEALKSSGATQEMAELGLADEDEMVRTGALMSPAATTEMAELGFADGCWLVRKAALVGPGGTTKLAERGLKDKEELVRKAAKDFLSRS